jgi:hypothetical protein
MDIKKTIERRMRRGITRETGASSSSDGRGGVRKTARPGPVHKSATSLHKYTWVLDIFPTISRGKPPDIYLWYILEEVKGGALWRRPVSPNCFVTGAAKLFAFPESFASRETGYGFGRLPRGFY